MTPYRKKPVVIHAQPWHDKGDLRGIVSSWSPWGQGFTSRPEFDECEECGEEMGAHGQIETLEGLMTVCPGDFIIRGVEGEHYSCKARIFRQTYEPITEEGHGE